MADNSKIKLADIQEEFQRRVPDPSEATAEDLLAAIAAAGGDSGDIQGCRIKVSCNSSGVCEVGVECDIPII
jgi:hypothetical protein